MKKPAMSEREIETLKLLKDLLPEYEIYPNMRLADVIKADWKLFNLISKYHLDFVVCDHKAHVIAAIELDDSTHDNKKARERDAKKDEYLRLAGISLFRIRVPHEVVQVATLIKRSESEQTAYSPRENASPAHSYTKSQSRYKTKGSIPLAKIAITVIGMLAIWFVFNNFSQNLQKQIIERSALARQTAMEQQRITIQHAHEISKQAQQQALPILAQANVVQQSELEQIFVKGRSARECRNTDGAMDNKTVLCMKDHYEMVKVGMAQEQRLKVVKIEQEKDAAWDKFYKEPPHCINPRVGEETRDCLNRNITAKNAFEAEWKVKHGDQ